MESDRRKSFRAPLVGGEEAILVVGKNQLVVRIIEESADGLTVFSDERPDFESGSMAELRGEDYCCDVHVVHIQIRGMKARIGLERVHQASETTRGERPLSSRFGGKGKRHRLPVNLLAGVLGFALVLGVVLAVVVKQSPPSRRELQSVVSFFHRALQASSDTTAGHPGVRVSVDKELRQKIRNKPGIDVFALQEVIDQLELTPQQQEKISKIAESTVATTEAMLAQDNHALMNRRYQELIASSQIEALAVLTHYQKNRLEAILEESISASQLVQHLAREYWPRANARQLIERLGGAALTLPGVAEQLEISDNQLIAIHRIVDEAFDQAEDLYRQARSSIRREELSARASTLLDQARADALSVLSEEQITRLNSMPR